MNDLTHKNGPITWVKAISIITNPLIFKQITLLSLCVGLFMAALLSLMLALSGDFAGIIPMLKVSFISAAALFLLLLLVALLYFRNRIEVRFTIDKRGVLWETVDKRALIGARLAVLGGILGRNPQAAGAGILAAAREKEFVSWSQVLSAEYNCRHKMIVLRNNWRPIMMLVCLPDNYKQVAALVSEKV